LRIAVATAGWHNRRRRQPNAIIEAELATMLTDIGANWLLLGAHRVLDLLTNL
jgi:hypothetical protein